MAALTVDLLFDAAVRIQVVEERALNVTYTPDGISIRFPTTRRLAEFLGVPHYYVLPVFGQMEEIGLITRAERVGIMTTAEGSRRFVSVMASRYRKEAQGVLGEPLLSEILARIGGET
jgi:DNA-binding transcriptional regulator YhcF (GntR family)